ncbi:hypothetical protein [Streptomyces sp. NBC_01803]|uniref:hypothetical protein n=1 Tax=Streptomyces sp. NBC_01803 TaxID=2975946 RepID=UPI002DD86E0F|nr:hypothetical protein [Streptomyces sp. NBC_01803]WSA46468.1 hypothetical protein OIE51_21150 [Streptomyces sp. NBC_01803]
MGSWSERCFELALAVGVPLLAVGGAAGGSLLVAHGPDGWPSTLTGGGLVLVACVGAFFSGVLYDNTLAFFSGFPLLVACIGAAGMVEEAALRSRGEATMCTVTEVDTRVETTTHTDSEGFTHTTTTTYYDHTLDCDATGGPDLMTRTERIADAGERIDVTYDPEGRVSPELTGDVSKGNHSNEWMLGIGLTVTLAIRVPVGLTEGSDIR